MNDSTSKVSPRKCSFLNEMSCVQTLTRFVRGLYIWKYSRRKRNKALQTNWRAKNRWSRRTGSEVYANPPTWNFPVQACDSNYITWKKTQIIDTLVAKFRKAHNATPRHDTFVKPIMPRHGMTLPSRHQDKLLQTPATLETLGSTSAVPLHRLEAWKAACVNSWIHHHGAACGKGFVSELSCRNHACWTTAEQR